MQERGLSRPRVWGLVAVGTLVLFGVWVCVFILVLALTFAPDAHIRFSAWDQVLQFGAPTLAAAVITLAVTTKLLDGWTFGPIEDRSGTAAQRWTVRLFPVFLLILIAAMIMSFRNFSIGFGVEP